MVRTTVRLPRKLVTWAKREAKKYGMGTGRFIGLLVKEHLDREEGKPGESSRYPHWPRVRARRRRPGIGP
jgi:hypothetical protein